jgi:hypothetical protein
MYNGLAKVDISLSPTAMDRIASWVPNHISDPTKTKNKGDVIRLRRLRRRGDRRLERISTETCVSVNKAYPPAKAPLTHNKWELISHTHIVGREKKYLITTSYAAINIITMIIIDNTLPTQSLIISIYFRVFTKSSISQIHE